MAAQHLDAPPNNDDTGSSGSLWCTSSPTYKLRWDAGEPQNDFVHPSVGNSLGVQSACKRRLSRL